MIANDTLVYGGENGIFYTVKLNAQFDAAAGTVSINPDGLIKTDTKAPAFPERCGRRALVRNRKLGCRVSQLCVLYR
jgi:hypothetical protein